LKKAQSNTHAYEGPKPTSAAINRKRVQGKISHHHRTPSPRGFIYSLFFHPSSHCKALMAYGANDVWSISRVINKKNDVWSISRVINKKRNSLQVLYLFTVLSFYILYL